jgi:hypothetical protein
MFGEGCVLKKGVLCKASNGMDFTRCPTRPRSARNDVHHTPSLRGVFDVAIHLHALTIAAKAAKAWIATLRSQ